MGFCGGHCFHLIQKSFASQSTNWHVIRASWIGCEDTRIKGIGTNCDQKAQCLFLNEQKCDTVSVHLEDNSGDYNSHFRSWISFSQNLLSTEFKYLPPPTPKKSVCLPVCLSIIPTYLSIFGALCWKHGARIFIIPQILLFGEIW